MKMVYVEVEIEIEFLIYMQILKSKTHGNCANNEM
jgi:hypothetical protein